MSDNLHESLSAMVDDEALELESARVLKAMAAGGADDLGGRWERWHLYSDALRGEQPALAPASLRQRVMAAVQAEAAGEGALPAEGSLSAEGSSLAEGSFSAEGSLLAEGSAPAAGQRRAAGEVVMPMWLRSTASLAVAAGITLAVVVGFQAAPLPVAGDEGTPAVALAVAVPVAASAAQANPLDTGAKRMLDLGLRTASGRLQVTGAPLVPVNAPRTRTAAELELAARQRLQAYMLRHAQHRALTDSRTMLPLVRVAAFEGQ